MKLEFVIPKTMDLTLIVPICIIVGLSAVFSSVRQYQMLQQNSYYVSRYCKWLYNNNFSGLVFTTFTYCISTVICRYNMVAELVLMCLFLAFNIISCVYHYKKSIKKLVFTGRVIRLYAALFIILAVLFTIIVKTQNTRVKMSLFFTFLLICIISPVIILLSRLLTVPAEKAMNLYFINDAKKILRSQKGIKVIGVTGSYGKTGTKFILSRILSEKYNVLATPHSYNTPMGVVRTVREKMRPQTEIFVCEMGAKNIGDIKEICDIVNPDCAIITSVGPQHLETFKTVDNVFKTKFELYDACKKKGGMVFVNGDSKEISKRIAGLDCITYGTQSNCDYIISDVVCSERGCEFTLKYKDTTLSLQTKLLGRHNIQNIAGSAAVALSLGVAPEDVAFAVARLEQTEHRLQLKPYINNSLVIDDAYNANPEGCIEAVNVLASFKNRKKVIVTPGLIELGAKEYDFNYNLGLAAAKVCDIIILVGKNRSKPMADAIKTTDYNAENVHIVSSFKEAMAIYSGFADENTVVLLENDLPDNYLS